MTPIQSSFPHGPGMQVCQLSPNLLLLTIILFLLNKHVTLSPLLADP